MNQEIKEWNYLMETLAISSCFLGLLGLAISMALQNLPSSCLSSLILLIGIIFACNELPMEEDYYGYK